MAVKGTVPQGKVADVRMCRLCSTRMHETGPSKPTSLLPYYLRYCKQHYATSHRRSGMHRNYLIILSFFETGHGLRNDYNGIKTTFA